MLAVVLFFAEVGLAAGGAAPASIQVYFSPKGGCTEAVVDAHSFGPAHDIPGLLAARPLRGESRSDGSAATRMN